MADSYSVKFVEEVKDFSRDSRYLHTKSLERCKWRLNHSSSRFCSSNCIQIAFIFDSKLITAASCNREENKSISVEVRKQQKTNGRSKCVFWCCADIIHFCCREQISAKGCLGSLLAKEYLGSFCCHNSADGFISYRVH